ncbi:hypothetical protein THOM_2189 [Trachipleistophora hominis]|uniref:Uncharacterized protein n=1 Tax=Trachipleistophora hominis TaxID=72359 RepID=L7JVV5_TRAHO|nr:hypothetical protein THOM_2189 [Trachipleistophora hominis]
MFALITMVKSLRNFIADSVTRLSSFINSSMVEDKTGSEDADWHDLGESEEKETVLFDDSISFSRDIVDDGKDRIGEDSVRKIDTERKERMNNEMGDGRGAGEVRDEGMDRGKKRKEDDSENRTVRNDKVEERRIVSQKIAGDGDNDVERGSYRLRGQNYGQSTECGSMSICGRGVVNTDTMGGSRSSRNQAVSQSMIDCGAEPAKSRNSVIYRSTGIHNYPIVPHQAEITCNQSTYIDECNNTQQSGVITLSYREYEMIERRISFLEDELRREVSRNAHTNTNHLLSALQEKDTKLSVLMDQINKLTVNEHRYKLQITTLEKDLTRANDRANAFKVIADEKVHCTTMENESLRDQLEFERSKNARLRSVLKEKESDARKYAMMNVEMVEYFRFMVDENVL